MRKIKIELNKSEFEEIISVICGGKKQKTNPVWEAFIDGSYSTEHRQSVCSTLSYRIVETVIYPMTETKPTVFTCTVSVIDNVETCLLQIPSVCVPFSGDEGHVSIRLYPTGWVEIETFAESWDFFFEILSLFHPTTKSVEVETPYGFMSLRVRIALVYCLLTNAFSNVILDMAQEGLLDGLDRD